MLKKKLLSILSITTLIVFVLSAILTVPALADSGTTPPTAPSSAGGRSSNKGSSNSLSQVPSGTKVVILDSSGNKVPLGSQEAAEIANNGDPIWCPSTVSAPNDSGLSGCTLPANSLALLISQIGTAGYIPTHTNSTIWISDAAPDSSSGAAIILNGSTQFSAWAPYTLTVKGGWIGDYGSGTINGISTLSVPLEIENWHNAVTISNLKSQNTGNYGDIAIPSQIGDGIYVQTSGNIHLSNFSAYTDYGNGAYLDNCELGLLTSGVCAGTGMVMITNSLFNGDAWGSNSHYGLFVKSNGAISLTGITANGNGGAGAELDNCNAVSSACTTNGRAVTLTGTNIFDTNTGFGVLDVYSFDMSGLYVLSGGTISSGSLEANDNARGVGVELNNAEAVSNLPVTVSAASSFAYNAGDGLNVFSKGAISVTNLMADYNGGNGAYLDNLNSSATPSAVSVSGTNGFNNNLYYDGLSVLSDGGISLNNITAQYNGTGGADGDYFDGIQADNRTAHTAQSITLTGNNNLSDNGDSGADFTSTGAVTLNNVNAVCNGYSGGDCFEGGTGTGATGGDGVLIENDYLPSPSLHPQAVIVLGTNNISESNADNLDVKTYGAIKINNLTADSSAAGDGANLYYHSLVPTDPTGAVILTGTNTFSHNKNDGLTIDSSGAVSLSNITATYNDSGSGVYVENDDLGLSKPQNVTLLGTNVFNNNGKDGLDVVSYGAITLNNITANTNSGSGVDLYYSNGISQDVTGVVTLTGTNTFNDDVGIGLVVDSKGAINASNLNAIGDINTSGSDGVDLTTTGAVTLTGTNTFDDYNGNGLNVNAQGNITASNLTAVDDGELGLFGGAILDNAGGTGHISLSGNNTFNDNYGDGIDISSNGTITTNNLTADADLTVDGSGVSIHEDGSKSVTLNGVNSFLNNGVDGLAILSDGAITVSNITANGNGAFGAQLDTCDANGSGCTFTNAQPITVTGTNVFLDNGAVEYNFFPVGSGNGLEINSDGAVSVSHITADDNYYDGMFVNAPGKVTVTCGSFMLNGQAIGTKHDGGYGVGWETGNSVVSTNLISTDSAGNYYGPYLNDVGSTIDNFSSVTCPLP